jgi:hypothetical protein
VTVHEPAALQHVVVTIWKRSLGPSSQGPILHSPKVSVHVAPLGMGAAGETSPSEGAVSELSMTAPLSCSFASTPQAANDNAPRHKIHRTLFMLPPMASPPRAVAAPGRTTWGRGKAVS